MSNILHLRVLGLLALCLAGSTAVSGPARARAPLPVLAVPVLELPVHTLPAVAEAAAQPEVRGTSEGDVVRLPTTGASPPLPVPAAAGWSGVHESVRAGPAGQLPLYFRSLPPPL